MKVYLSADIEGITGTTHWDETEKKHDDYPAFQKQMTAEVAAACQGVLASGASEIWVKDAHDSGRNLTAADLPRETRLLRGWSGHPYLMMEGIDPSFQAAMMVGYHSRAGAGANPLSHTMTGGIYAVKINGHSASEFMVNAYTAGLAKVPVVFVSGDAGLCEDAAALVPGITAVAVKQGQGGSTNNLHPQAAVEQIRAGVEKALTGDLSKCLVKLPEHFSVEIQFKEHTKAYRASFYPGGHSVNATTVQYEYTDYLDVLKLFLFVI